MSYSETGDVADALVNEMMGGGAAYLPNIEHTVIGAKPPKLRYSHQAMVDMLVQNPQLKQNDLAVMFDKSPAWISTIITSDAFQGRLAERRDEYLDPELRLSLQERFRALTTRSLQILQERLEGNPSDNLLLKTTDLGAKALGLGGNAPAPVVITSEERLAALANRLKSLQGGAGVSGAGESQVVDVSFREVSA